MTEPERTTGLLPVREHLRPQPTGHAVAFLFDRQPDGRYAFDFYSVEEIVDAPIKGEA